MNRFDATAFLKSAHDPLSGDAEDDRPDASVEPQSQPHGGLPSGKPVQETHHSESFSGLLSELQGSGAFPGEALADWSASQIPDGEWLSAVGAQSFFVPLNYEANYRYPLVIWLHSDGYNENQVCHVMPHVSSRNYLATGIRAPKSVDPSGHRFAWSDSEAGVLRAENEVMAAIDLTAKRYSIHAQRLVLAGYSHGGTMAMRIAMRNPDLFAAAISLGGVFPQDGISGLDRQRLRERRLPMLWQRSIQSHFYNEAKLSAEIAAARSIGAQLEIRQYRNDDEMNTAVLSDLDRWIMNHVVGGAPVAKMDRWETSPTSFSDN